VAIFSPVLAPFVAVIVTIAVTAPRGNAARALGIFVLAWMVFGFWIFRRILNWEANMVSSREIEHAQEIYGRISRH
jgi:glycerol kinase